MCLALVSMVLALVTQVLALVPVVLALVPMAISVVLALNRWWGPNPDLHTLQVVCARRSGLPHCAPFQGVSSYEVGQLKMACWEQVPGLLGPA